MYKIFQQGEVRVMKIDRLPKGMATKPVATDDKGRAIISHSESGNHHVIAGADVLERTDKVPAGMAILYAIVRNPTALKHDAPSSHAEIPLEADSIYELRISREFDPFAEQIRRVAD